jgi:hypothetical protein
MVDTGGGSGNCQATCAVNLLSHPRQLTPFAGSGRYANITNTERSFLRHSGLAQTGEKVASNKTRMIFGTPKFPMAFNRVMLAKMVGSPDRDTLRISMHSSVYRHHGRRQLPPQSQANDGSRPSRFEPPGLVPAMAGMGQLPTIPVSPGA